MIKVNAEAQVIRNQMAATEVQKTGICSGRTVAKVAVGLAVAATVAAVAYAAYQSAQVLPPMQGPQLPKCFTIFNNSTNTTAPLCEAPLGKLTMMMNLDEYARDKGIYNAMSAINNALSTAGSAIKTALWDTSFQQKVEVVGNAIENTPNAIVSIYNLLRYAPRG